MQTTKKSPFTQFDPNYYATLRKVSFAKAEEYRQKVIQGTKNTIDLGANYGKEPVNELVARGITQENQDGLEKRELLKARGGIDLAEQFDNGMLGVGNPLESNPEELKQEPSIDLSLLITDPGAITEEQILGRPPLPEENEETEDNESETEDNESGEGAEESQLEEGEEDNESEATEETNEGSDTDVPTKEAEATTISIELTETERKHILDQFKARGQFIPTNIGSEKLYNKAKEAGIL